MTGVAFTEKKTQGNEVRACPHCTMKHLGPDLEENVAKPAADSVLAFETTGQGANWGGVFVLWANFNQAPGRVNQLITHRLLAQY